MDLEIVKIKNPDSLNLIFGQSHFIKTVEDLHEALMAAVPNIKFGLAFAEASGPCLTRSSGTDKKLVKLAEENILKIGAGHSFLIFLKNCFPINVLSSIRQTAEVCQIFCASANPVEVVICQTKNGRAVLGVVDGQSPQGIEKAKQRKQRKEFLRQIGYKLGND